MVSTPLLIKCAPNFIPTVFWNQKFKHVCNRCIIIIQTQHTILHHWSYLRVGLHPSKVFIVLVHPSEINKKRDQPIR